MTLTLSHLNPSILYPFPSFPRKRESRMVQEATELTALDSRFRGKDEHGRSVAVLLTTPHSSSSDLIRRSRMLASKNVFNPLDSRLRGNDDDGCGRRRIQNEKYLAIQPFREFWNMVVTHTFNAPSCPSYRLDCIVYWLVACMGVIRWARYSFRNRQRPPYWDYSILFSSVTHFSRSGGGDARLEEAANTVSSNSFYHRCNWYNFNCVDWVSAVWVSNVRKRTSHA